ncbi:M20 family metallopeptidase [Microbacterium sp. No. 7]|uniref:M20 family metallopeptidase n=1 Tax=Microbacterium sp. No. 7 TaxID=1714373 RepID=UPI001E5C17D8|nr:M20 family metallopeptidase [Microbacterium sp. No. 7]
MTTSQPRVGPHPRTPDRSYLDALEGEARRKAAAAAPVTSPFAGVPGKLAARVGAALDGLQERLVALSHDIFDHPEEAFREVRSAAAVAEIVRAAGVETRVGVHGLDTALRAEIGVLSHAGGVQPDGGGVRSGARDVPTIAILAEYDALPGIGHGCGHNVIAASSVGAFLALAAVADELPGRVVLLGTPAEEGHSGKEILARGGAFDDVDAAIMAHPFGYDAIDHPFIGRRILRVRYNGVAAHASASPFLGRNALDAVALNYQAVGLLRQHLPQSDRVHGIVLDGGDRPSIVPEVATIEYYLRSHLPETLRDLSARMEDIAHGAALATGTGVELTWDPQPFTLPTRFNGPLSARWAVHQAARGRTALTRAVVPAELAASTDFGNVSHRVPGIHPVIAVGPPDVALHTAEFGRHARGPRGDRAVADAAYGLALTALDYLSDAELRAAVDDDFARAGGVTDVERYFDPPVEGAPASGLRGEARA